MRSMWRDALPRRNSSENQRVCPKCSHHMRIGARMRLESFLDQDQQEEIGGNVEPLDALRFKDSKKIPRPLDAGSAEHRRERCADRHGGNT